MRQVGFVVLTGRFSWQITREARLAGIPRASAASEVVPLLIGRIRRIGRIGLIGRPGVPATIRRWLVHFKGDLNTRKHTNHLPTGRAWDRASHSQVVNAL